MNVAQQAAHRKWLERQLLVTAARTPTFSLQDLWKANKWISYGNISRILLKWWREDGLTLRLDGDKWREGNIYSRVATRKQLAIYKWKDEP